MDSSWASRVGGLSPALLCACVLAFILFLADLYSYGILGNPPCNQFNCSATIPRPSVKLLMQDHMGHYVHHFGAEAFEEQFHVSALPFISPNFITTLHLFVGAFAGYLVSFEQLKWRQVGVGLFQLRTFLDMLDGVVYRRQHKLHMYVNGWGTLGYYIDAGADTIGAMFLMWGVFTFLTRHPPRRCEGLPMRNPPDVQTDVPVTTSAIKLTIVLCVLQGLLRSFGWDRYQYAFHSIFNIALPRKSDAILQARIFNSPLTRFILWCWKLSSAEGLMGFVYLGVFLDFVWPMLVLIRKYGFIQLAVVVIISQLHLWQVRELMGKAVQVS